MRDDIQLQKLFVVAAKDEDYKKIVEALREEAEPKRLVKDHPARAFVSEWTNLSLSDSKVDPLLVVEGHHIVVPQEMRAEILRTLHLPQFGQKKTNLTLRYRYSWLGMLGEINQMCSSCKACAKYLPSRSREKFWMDCKSLEDMEPMEALSIDFLKAKGSDYLAVVDRASGFAWCQKMSATTRKVTTDKLRRSGRMEGRNSAAPSRPGAGTWVSNMSYLVLITWNRTGMQRLE